MNQRELVKSVSRSFALSLLWLPRSKRQAVSVAYLLARFADTLSDSGSWTSDERLSHLEAWENAILTKNLAGWNLKGSLNSFATKESHLLRSADLLLKSYLELEPYQQSLVSDVVKTLIQGMKWDLKIFAHAESAQPVRGIHDEKTFDWYCYTIAGCVGDFWVKIFDLRSDLSFLAITYGKALQRINILRDVREDFLRGRIYLVGTQEGAPWQRSDWPIFYKKYIGDTKRMLIEGAYFCDSIPRHRFRLRLSSMLPVMIGVKTLQKLEVSDFWNGVVKISRPEVRTLVMVAGIRTLFGLSVTSWTKRFVK